MRTWVATKSALLAVILSACSQPVVTPPPPTPTPSLPVAVDPILATFWASQLQTGSTLRVVVEAVNTDRANAYGTLRVALALRGTGLVDLGQDLSVASSPDARCALPFRGSLPRTQPSDYPGGWAVEYDVEPAGGPVLAVGPGGTLASTCVFLSVVRPGVSGATLEGVFFVYEDANPLNSRFDAAEQIRSGPLGAPMHVSLRIVEARP
ncbi:MAG: hypothetical protein N0A24_11040 [Armatimonadetes bacterium]|nr:hypothetical protein [Armatimonadota bacterium]MDW8154711.1 hypothetical protein [Armatimonadota bacterium]